MNFVFFIVLDTPKSLWAQLRRSGRVRSSTVAICRNSLINKLLLGPSRSQSFKNSKTLIKYPFEIVEGKGVILDNLSRISVSGKEVQSGGAPIDIKVSLGFETKQTYIPSTIYANLIQAIEDHVKDKFSYKERHHSLNCYRGLKQHDLPILRIAVPSKAHSKPFATENQNLGVNGGENGAIEANGSVGTHSLQASSSEEILLKQNQYSSKYAQDKDVLCVDLAEWKQDHLTLGYLFLNGFTLHVDYDSSLMTVDYSTSCFKLMSNIYDTSMTPTELHVLKIVMWCKKNRSLNLTSVENLILNFIFFA